MIRDNLTLQVYRNMSREDWLCTLGLRGCAMHRKSGFYTPLWRDPRRWLY